MTSVLGLITARGGSKGVPGKNVRPLAGKPLIAWTIEAARASGRLDRVVVSTDDDEIAAVAREFGAEVPFMRPAELAQDDSPHILSVLHALDELAGLEQYAPDAVCLLQPTSPLRTAEDIDAAIAIACESDAPAVVSVTEALAHPQLTQRMDADGRLHPFMEADTDYLRRQDLPDAYVLNGAVYVNTTDSLRRDETFYPEGLRGYVMPPERSLDIDTLWDFHLAELILCDRAGDRPAEGGPP